MEPPLNSNPLTRSSNLLVGLALTVALSFAWAIIPAERGFGQQDPPPQVQPPGQEDDGDRRQGILIPVSLPITRESAEQVRQSLEAALEISESTSDDSQLPIALLEFDTRNSRTGRGSDFHSCLALAEMLTENRMNRIKKVAYIPAPSGLAPDTEDAEALPISHLKGHAVLVALACNELAMHNESAIGEAGVDEQLVGRTRIVAYEEIAMKRLIFPVPLVRSMIDKDLAVFRIETPDGYDFVDRKTFESMRDELTSFATITEEASYPLLYSKDLSEYGLLRNRVGSRKQLAARLKIDAETLEVNPLTGKQINSVQLNVSGMLDKRNVNWLIRSMNQQGDSINLVIVKIDATEGEPFECLRLAEYLASFDSSKVWTVAYVPTNAGGAVSLVALACDHLVMAESAKIGGTTPMFDQPEQMNDLNRAIKTLAPKTKRSWSVLRAFVDPSLQLKKMQNSKSGDIAYLTDEEKAGFDDAELWNSRGMVIIGDDGMTGGEALQYEFANMLISDFEQLKSTYGLKSDPPVLQPTIADQWIESFARTLASPWVAGWLLFGAMFLLSTELSSPGIGVPGFLGTVCLILFFWSQYFDGNAHWLEIMLFVAGCVFLALEMFVLPGFGIFGIGGLFMVVTSIVLATQTFVIPRNSEEFSRLPVSLTMVLAATAGFFVAIAIFGRYLPKTPFFRRMLLDPNEDSESRQSRIDRESIVKWEHLMGQTGTAITQMAPTGKAKIGSQVVDVISRGRFIDKGDRVEVVEVSGNRVVVSAVEQSG